MCKFLYNTFVGIICQCDADQHIWFGRELWIGGSRHPHYIHLVYVVVHLLNADHCLYLTLTLIAGCIFQLTCIGVVWVGVYLLQWTPLFVWAEGEEEAVLVMWSVPVGVQRVHDARRQPPSGAESDTADRPEGDRTHGGHHPQEILRHRNAAEAEHVWSCDDPEVSVLGCQVWFSTPVWGCHVLGWNGFSWFVVVWVMPCSWWIQHHHCDTSCVDFLQAIFCLPVFADSFEHFRTVSPFSFCRRSIRWFDVCVYVQAFTVACLSWQCHFH